DLFALMGRQSLAGRLALSGRTDLAEGQLADWQNVFTDRLYLELVRTGRDGEEAFNHFALHASAKRQIPVLASNDVRFLAPDDFQAHEARPSISSGPVLHAHKRPRVYSREQYLKSTESMFCPFADP